MDLAFAVRERIEMYLGQKRRILNIILENGGLIAGGVILNAIHGGVISGINVYVDDARRFNRMISMIDPYCIERRIETQLPFEIPPVIKNRIRCVCQMVPDNDRYIDIILCSQPAISVINQFDLSFCSVWYDGKKIYGNIDEAKQRSGRLNDELIQYLVSGDEYILNRMRKYRIKGYSVYIPKFDGIKLGPDISGIDRELREVEREPVYGFRKILNSIDWSKFIKYDDINQQSPFELLNAANTEDFCKLNKSIDRTQIVNAVNKVCDFLDNICPYENLLGLDKKYSVYISVANDLVILVNHYKILDDELEFYSMFILDRLSLFLYFKQIPVSDSVSKIKFMLRDNTEFITALDKDFILNDIGNQIQEVFNSIRYLDWHFRSVVHKLIYIASIVLELIGQELEESVSMRFAYLKSIYNLPSNTEFQSIKVGSDRLAKIFNTEFFNIIDQERYTVSSYFDENPTDIVFVDTNDKPVGTISINRLRMILEKDNLIVRCSRSMSATPVLRDIDLDEFYTIMPIGSTGRECIPTRLLLEVVKQYETEGNVLYMINDKQSIPVTTMINNIIIYPEAQANIFQQPINIVSGIHCGPDSSFISWNSVKTVV